MALNKSVSIKATAKTEGAVQPLSKLKAQLDATRAATAKADAQAQKLAQTQARAGKSFSQQSAEMGMAIARMAGPLGMAALAAEKLSARHLQNANITKNLKISIDAARVATQGFVSDMDLSRSAAMATGFGVAKTAEEFATLAAVAQKLAARMGTDTATALQDLTTAISRQSPMILDNLGITLKLSEAHEMYARKLGKSVKDLSDVEKAEAFRVAALQKAEEATKGVNVATEGSAASIQRAKVGLINATEATLDYAFAASDKLLPVMNELVVAMSAGALGTTEHERVLDDLEKANKRAAASIHASNDALRRAIIETGNASGPITSLMGHVDRLGAAWDRLRSKTAVEGLASSLQGVDAAARQILIDATVKGLADSVALVDAESKKIIDKAGRSAGDRFARQRADFAAAMAAAQRGRGLAAMDRSAFTASQSFGAELGMAQDAAAMRAAGEAFGTGPGSRSDELARLEESEAAKAEILLNARMRGIEEQRAAGVEPLQLINEEEAARIAFLEGEMSRADTKIEKLYLTDQIEAEKHAARLKRMDVEAAKQRKHQAMVLGYTTALQEAMIGTGAAALQAALMGEGGIRAAVHNFAKGKGIEMAILAASETARGVAALASPFTAALAPGHFAAAGQAAAAGALIGAVAGVTVGGGGGGRGESGGLPGGAGGGGIDLGGRGAVGPGGPILSRASQAVQSQAGSSKGGGGTVVLNAQFHALGFASKDEVIGGLRSELERHKQMIGKL